LIGMDERRHWLAGGVAGIAGALCYVGAVLVQWPDTQAGTSIGMLLVSAWPILSIAFCYFGAALIGLNLATFPWPPATRGLFDIGPFIALYMAALAVRLILAGWRARKAPAA
jgi:hypothetical protein